jgi:hypothetical protein
VHDDAPLTPRRAASVMVAVTRELEHLDPTGKSPIDLRADRIELAADGSVRITGTGTPHGVTAGAGVGRLLFELLVGRPPLGSEDAFEPHLCEALNPSTVSLLARSASPSPGQWPTVADWSAELALVAGGQAPPEPPSRATSKRRRRLALAVTLLLLASVTVLVLLLAPGWWDAATTEDSAGSTSAQLVDRS